MAALKFFHQRRGEAAVGLVGHFDSLIVTCDNEPFPEIEQPVYRYGGFLPLPSLHRQKAASQHALCPSVITPCSRSQPVA